LLRRTEEYRDFWIFGGRDFDCGVGRCGSSILGFAAAGPALGIFSGTGDFSRAGDFAACFYTLEGFAGELPVIDPSHAAPDEYYGKTDPKDQVLSPFFADWKGMPPALLVTSTRDILLSGTTMLHRRY